MFFPDRGPVAAYHTFSEAFDPKRNAFAFLRMVLAVMVIISHCFVLGGFGLDFLGRFTEGRHDLAQIAVNVFFVFSGFLIARSSLRSRSVGRFLWHRFLRIFPGYWICLLVTAFVFSPIFELIKHGVFSAESSLAYVRGNWAMFHLNEFSIPGVMVPWPPTIGSVLKQNPNPWTINGSLWSLPFECAFYLVLGLLTFGGILRRARFGVIFLFAGLWVLHAFVFLDPDYFRECFPYRGFKSLILLGVYFSAGCLCYLYRKTIPASKILFVASLVLVAVGLAFNSFPLVAPIALSYAALCMAFWLPIPRFDAWGDFSYGTYIYAFPLQQGLILLGVHRSGVTVFLVSTVLLTLVLAALSYHVIEAPSLRWKDFDLFGSRNQFSPLSKDRVSDEALVLVPERVE